MEWVRLGAPHPKIVTSDDSKALLNAVVRAFTGHFTIDGYVNFYDRQLPNCFIRIDGAHFLNIYVKFLKKVCKLSKIRIFFKAALGQLMIYTDEEIAKKILKAIFIVSYSETDEKLIGRTDKTECDIQRNYIYI